MCSIVASTFQAEYFFIWEEVPVKCMKQESFVSCRYMVGGYLSAEAVVNMFSKAVMETVNWPSINSTLDCVVRPVLGGPDLKLEIRCVSDLFFYVLQI